MADWVLENGFWVLEVTWRNGFKTRWTRLFFIFCQFFWHYLIILQSGVCQRYCKPFMNNQICQKSSKKWRKALFIQLALNLFFGLFQKIKFWVHTSSITIPKSLLHYKTSTLQPFVIWMLELYSSLSRTHCSKWFTKCDTTIVFHEFFLQFDFIISLWRCVTKAIFPWAEILIIS